MCPADPPTGPPPPRRRRSLGRGGTAGWPRLGQGADRDAREPRPRAPDARPATAEDTGSAAPGGAAAPAETFQVPAPLGAMPAPVMGEATPATAEDTGSAAPGGAAAPAETFQVPAPQEATPAPVAGEATPSPQEAAAPAARPGALRDGAPQGKAPAPDGRFTLRLANFEGPFDLLLQLISRHKLDVTEVALSQVTDEFMAHIRAMGSDWDLDQTTEFLVVAATLLDLKAARLLPAAEIEDEADLALLEARDLLFARLLQYRAYKRVADILSDRLDQEARRYPRTVSLEPHHAALLPEVVIRIGAEGFARLAVKAMQPRPEPTVYVEHIHAPLVSVREQAEVVVARLRDVGEADFADLVADAGDTLTVVARFLALLELYREKAVALDQEDALGPLTVRWTGAEDGAVPTVTDEFDQEHRPREEPGKQEREPEEETT